MGRAPFNGGTIGCCSPSWEKGRFGTGNVMSHCSRYMVVGNTRSAYGEVSSIRVANWTTWGIRDSHSCHGFLSVGRYSGSTWAIINMFRSGSFPAERRWGSSSAAQWAGRSDSGARDGLREKAPDRMFTEETGVGPQGSETVSRHNPFAEKLPERALRLATAHWVKRAVSLRSDTPPERARGALAELNSRASRSRVSAGTPVMAETLSGG